MRQSLRDVIGALRAAGQDAKEARRWWQNVSRRLEPRPVGWCRRCRVPLVRLAAGHLRCPACGSDYVG